MLIKNNAEALDSYYSQCCVDIKVDQPKLGLPSRDYFLKGRQEKAFVAYEYFALNLAVSLGADKIQAAQDVDAMMQFEVELAKARNFCELI